MAEIPNHKSIQAQENEMVALAFDLVAKRLREGTATSQETCHFLKIGSTQHQIEMENLREENRLLKAKTESLESAKEVKKIYEDAIAAFRSYQPTQVSADESVSNV